MFAVLINMLDPAWHGPIWPTLGCLLHLCLTWSGFRVDFVAVQRWGRRCLRAATNKGPRLLRKNIVCLLRTRPQQPRLATRGSCKACHLGNPDLTVNKMMGFEGGVSLLTNEHFYQESRFWGFPSQTEKSKGLKISYSPPQVYVYIYM